MARKKEVKSCENCGDQSESRCDCCEEHENWTPIEGKGTALVKKRKARDKGAVPLEDEFHLEPHAPTPVEQHENEEVPTIERPKASNPDTCKGCVHEDLSADDAPCSGCEPHGDEAGNPTQFEARPPKKQKKEQSVLGLEDAAPKAPAPAQDAPAVVEGYECPLSGYILTYEAIQRGYCETCPRRSKSEIGTQMCGRVI